jgi:DHA3 family tetracycline resistance protein-like MFS transporter
VRKLSAPTAYYILEIAVSLFFSIIFTSNMLYQVTMVGLNPLQLVLVGTMLETAVFLFEVPTGVVADVYSRRLSIIIGYVLIGAGFILEGSIPTFAAVVAGQAIWGLGYTFTSGATQAWIVDEVGEENAGKIFVRGSQAGELGGLIGILASVGLGSIQVNIPVITGGVLLIGLAVFLALVMPETGFKPLPREERSSWQQMVHTLRQGVRLVRGRPSLVNLILIGLFFGLYSEGFDRLWTAHLLDDIGLPVLGNLKPVVWIGMINLVGSLIILGGSEVARRKLNPDHPPTAMWTIFASSLALLAGLLTFALTRRFELALAAYWTIGLTRNLTYPYYEAWLNRRLESSVRATVISMTGQIDALGQITAGPVMGVIGRTVSIRAALVTSALLLSPVLGLIGRAIRLERGERLEPEPAQE